MPAFAKIVPALLVVGLLGAACSSSSSGGGANPNSTAPRTTSSSDTTSATDTASNASTPTPGQSDGSGGSVPSAATLKGIVVQQSDLPSGWTGKAASPETGKDKGVDSELAACVGTGNAGDQNKVQEIQSDDFSKGQAQVSSDASSYNSPSDVQAQVALLESPKAQPCLNSLFKREISSSLPSSASIKSISLKLNTSGTGIPNLVGTANGKISIASNGQQLSIYIGAAFFTGTQLTGEVTFTSIGAPISSAFANPIVEAVAKRAAAA